MPNLVTTADQEVEMDRRRSERRNEENAERPATNPPRARKQRRRQIDPTTCERDYNGEEIEFMQALDAYKRSSGRMFPTCSEILEVIRDLGYFRLDEDQIAELFPTSNSSESLPPEELEDIIDDELAEELDGAI